MTITSLQMRKAFFLFVSEMHIYIITIIGKA